jgi:hypothetical protein
MKKSIKVLAISFLLHFIVSASAMAVPISGTALQAFFDAQGWGINAVNDQMPGNHNWSLTNASGASNMVFYYENPSGMTFGIYSTAGLQEATVFDDSDTPIAKAVVSFDGGETLVVQYWDAGGYFLDKDTYAFSGETFGFWISDGTNKYYSDANKNDVNKNGTFGEEEDIALLVYNADPGSYVFAGDTDGDRDFANIVTQAESILPSPEPASMVLLGMGLLGLAGVTRKKIISSN